MINSQLLKLPPSQTRLKVQKVYEPLTFCCISLSFSVNMCYGAQEVFIKMVLWGTHN